jgi:hypothetical protein
MTTFDNNFCLKKPTQFYCEVCDYKSSYSRDYKRHLLTKKHKNNEIAQNNNELGPNLPKKIYSCENCDKKFKDRAGLWRHKKKCEIDIIDNIELTDKDLIITLIKQNSELMSLLSTNNITNNNSHNTTNTNTNSHNKTFNLNFFLNETCKNAMNISEFVSSIKVNLEDLEYTGRQGYIQGISNIILNNLQKLEQHERPLHCNDLKREVLYIKDNDKWEKETEQKPILTKAIKTIANENIKQIKHWREKYPDCTNADSKKNNMYLKIVSNSMNGLTEEESHKNIDRIISNVAKEVVIDKE